MAASGEEVRGLEEELALLEGDFAACGASMVSLLLRIRKQTPATGRRTAHTQEEKRLYILGVQALNIVAGAALTAFGQASPQLGAQEKWITPRLRKPVLRYGHRVARLSYMNISMDILMALTKGDGTKLDPPSTIYGRTTGFCTLDSEETLLQAASEVLQLSSTAEADTYSYVQGFKVVLPAIDDDDHAWKTAAFAYVARTLTALAQSHSVWFSTVTQHFTATLWGQVVPGTDVTAFRPYTGPAQATACVLQKVQPTGRSLANSEKQEELWDHLKIALKRLSSSKVGQLEGQARAAFTIIRDAGGGDRNNGDTLFSSEYSEAVFKTAVLGLEILDRKLRDYFGISAPLGDDIEAHQPAIDRNPRPNWLDTLNTRRWTILECLDHLFSRKGDDPARLNTASSIIALCQGANVGAAVHKDHPEKVLAWAVSSAQWTQEWRQEMMGYVRLAIVGAAQFLSSEFGDADVKLGGKIVPRAKDRELWLRDRVRANDV